PRGGGRGPAGPARRPGRRKQSIAERSVASQEEAQPGPGPGREQEAAQEILDTLDRLQPAECSHDEVALAVPEPSAAGGARSARMPVRPEIDPRADHPPSLGPADPTTDVLLGAAPG